MKAAEEKEGQRFEIKGGLDDSKRSEKETLNSLVGSVHSATLLFQSQIWSSLRDERKE